MAVFLSDANVWVALSMTHHAHHEVCRQWLDSVAEVGAVVFCRATQQSFLRLVTTPAVVAQLGGRALSNAEAWRAYDAFLADDRVIFADEPSGLEQQWRQFGGRDTASSKLWMDSYLAAFAVAAGVRMVTHDRAFRQFRGLDLILLTETGSPRSN